MIYTSYYGNLRKIPRGIVPINIANITPYNYMGPSLPALFPPWWLVERYKADGDWAFYVNTYTKRVLDIYDPKEIEKAIKQIASGGDAVLVCYERPEKHCHRHLVRDWFNKNDIPCKEWEVL